MFEDTEINLVVSIGSQKKSVDDIARDLGILSEGARELLEYAYSRCIVNKSHGERYTISDFYSRFDHFAKFEYWNEFPAGDRKKIDQRFLNEFINRYKRDIEQEKSNIKEFNPLPNDTVMLLDEVEEMVNAANLIVVQPCDCRILGDNCDRPVETCISLDEGARQILERGHGHLLTKEEAVHLLRWADKKGLMHTADNAWKEQSLHSICNCCACDCYPFRAAQQLGTKGVWPKSRYQAVFNQDLCSLCGACVKRCHFQAFSLTEQLVEINGKIKQNVRYDVDKCWGCGLCAYYCPQDDITMRPLVS